MYRGTTPLLIINVEGDFPFAQITALQLDIACTLNRVRKGEEDVTWDGANSRLLCQLTQEETLQLSGTIQVQMRYQYASGQTFATNIASTTISSIISNNIIGADEVQGAAPMLEAITLTTQPSEGEVTIATDYGTIIGGGGSAEWGQIEGDINNQTDLKERLLSLQSAIGSEAIERVTEDTDLAQRISLKQEKIDNNLETEATSVVGAINEVRTNIIQEGQSRMQADNALSEGLEGKVDNYVGNPTMNGTYCYVYAKNGAAFANGARLLSNSALYGGGKDDRNSVVQRTGLNINTADATLDSHVPSWGQTKQYTDNKVTPLEAKIANLAQLTINGEYEDGGVFELIVLGKLTE
ncbi:MAG: hypothetical protein HUJ96_02850 [Marinilabiliaceae bacterium]|nr:hypothetical protein [Marinilabiliaceae bacterium]